MSQKIGKRTIPAKEEEFVEEGCCDLCGAVIEGDYAYEFDEIVVRARNGTRYPEGGDEHAEEFDVCRKCWETKLKPWFQSVRGATPRVADQSW